jgi:hypothetical protein
MRDEKYNGWTNKPTWLVNLWMDNDQGTQERIRELAKECLDDAEGDEADAAADLALRLESMHDEGLTEIPGLSTGVFSDLMTWALAHVNWREIAESWVDDAIEEWRENNPPDNSDDDPEPDEGPSDQDIERAENDYERTLASRGE